MLDFILKYWVEFLLGIVAAGITIFFKSYINLVKNTLDTQKKEFLETIDTTFNNKLNEIDQRIETIENYTQEINNAQQEQISNLTKGLLSVQGRQFKSECQTLLEEEHQITMAEYEQFESDYEAYKALGGNHYGDQLHQLVVKKFEQNVIPVIPTKDE